MGQDTCNKVHVFHEPWTIPQAHEIPLYHFTRENTRVVIYSHLYFRREGRCKEFIKLERIATN